MPTYIAFLRAVNVGGRVVRMAELRGTLEDAGFADVETHIQSGNVVVRSRHRSAESAAKAISGVLGEWAGFDIPSIVRTPDQVGALLAEADAVPPLLPGEPKRYVAVADGEISQEAAAAFSSWEADGEAARALTGAVLLELGVAFHRSTLTNARIERITSLTTTVRALDVVNAVHERWGER